MDLFEDEDVVLSRSELGKYSLSEDLQHLLGFNVESPSLSPAPGSVESIPEISDEKERSISPSHDFAGYFKYFYSIDLENVERIRERFTNEYNLVHITKLIQDKVERIATALCAIHVIGERLRQKPKEVILTICKEELTQFHTELVNQFAEVQRFLAVQYRLIHGITEKGNPKKIESSHPQPSVELAQETCLEPCTENDFQVSEPSDELFVFESVEGKSAHSSCSDRFDIEIHDEVYETIATEAGVEKSSTYSEMDMDFLSTHSLLLDQLKHKLKPRRLEMENREKEAYFRIYGKYPAETVASDDSVRDSDLTVEGSDEVETYECGTESYSEETDTNMERCVGLNEGKIEFMESLRSALNIGARCGNYGLVPVPEKELTSLPDQISN